MQLKMSSAKCPPFCSGPHVSIMERQKRINPVIMYIHNSIMYIHNCKPITNKAAIIDIHNCKPITNKAAIMDIHNWLWISLLALWVAIIAYWNLSHLSWTRYKFTHNAIMDIHNWIMWYPWLRRIMDIQNWIMDIHNWIMDIHNYRVYALWAFHSRWTKYLIVRKGPLDDDVRTEALHRDRCGQAGVELLQGRLRRQ